MSIDVAHRAGDTGSAADPAAGQVRLPGVGTATSPASSSQTELLDLLRLDDPQIRSVFLNSAINRRFPSLPSVGPDGSRPTESQGDPLTKHRVQGLDMGSRALEDCLDRVGAELCDVRYPCCGSSPGRPAPG